MKHDDWLASLVGKRFKSGGTGIVYKCVAADRRDVTVVSERDSTDVRKLSDSAIGRTFHEVANTDQSNA